MKSSPTGHGPLDPQRSRSKIQEFLPTKILTGPPTGPAKEQGSSDISQLLNPTHSHTHIRVMPIVPASRTTEDKPVLADGEEILDVEADVEMYLGEDLTGKGLVYVTSK